VIETTYSVANSQIQSTQEEKDLGVITDSKMSFESHINSIAARASRIMGMIRRSYTYLSVTNFPLLFKGLVRPLLEYAQAAWQPYKVKDIETLENVQRRATKQVQGIRDLSYPDRLRTLSLTTLTYRRLRGDMVEVYKILHGRYDSRAGHTLLHRSINHRTRGHPFKLEKQHCRRNVRLHSFGHRVISWWNGPPAGVVTAPSILSFEKRLDKHWENNPQKYEIRLEQRAGHIGR
jgi:ribonuclease P/MRP protein subunit RPP40